MVGDLDDHPKGGSSSEELRPILRAVPFRRYHEQAGAEGQRRRGRTSTLLICRDPYSADLHCPGTRRQTRATACTLRGSQGRPGMRRDAGAGGSLALVDCEETRLTMGNVSKRTYSVM